MINQSTIEVSESELEDIVFKSCCKKKCIMKISEGTDYTKSFEYCRKSRAFINTAMFGYEEKSQRKHDIIQKLVEGKLKLSIHCE